MIILIIIIGFQVKRPWEAHKPHKVNKRKNEEALKYFYLANVKRNERKKRITVIYTHKREYIKYN